MKTLSCSTLSLLFFVTFGLARIFMPNLNIPFKIQLALSNYSCV